MQLQASPLLVGALQTALQASPLRVAALQAPATSAVARAVPINRQRQPAATA